MRDIRNELDVECPRCKGMHLEEAPKEIWDPEEEWVLEKKCVGADTPILTQEAGILLVRFVKKGMHVLGKDGEYHKVLSIIRRRLSARKNLIGVRTWGVKKFFLTEDHKVLAGNGSSLEWVEAGDIKVGAFLFVPRPKFTSSSVLPHDFFEFRSVGGYTKKVRRLPAFFRFMGFWVGDGTSCTKEQLLNKTMNRMGLSVSDLGRKGKLWSDIYERIVKEELQIEHLIKDVRKGRLTSVFWTDGPMVRWLNSSFRRFSGGGNEKTIPDWFDELTNREFWAFLQGLWDADGSGSSPGLLRGKSSIATTSQTVSIGVYLQCLKRGIAVSVYRALAKLHYKGREIRRRYFVLWFPVDTYRAPILTENGWFFRVADVEKRKAKSGETVFDLEVDGEHSFQTIGATLHNCDGNRLTLQIGKDGSLLRGRNRQDFMKGVAKAKGFRDLGYMNPSFLELKSVELDGILLDGELTEVYTSKGVWNETTMVRAENGEFLGMTAWTVLFCKGKDLRGNTDKFRRGMLELVIEELGDSRIRAVERVPATKENLRMFFDRGDEGAIAKKLSGTISVGSRVCSTWWKIKSDGERVVKAFITGVQQAASGGSAIRGIKKKPNGKAATFSVSMMKDGLPIEVGKMSNLPDEAREFGFKEFKDFKNRVVEMRVSGFDGKRLRWCRYSKFLPDVDASACKFEDQVKGGGNAVEQKTDEA